MPVSLVRDCPHCGAARIAMTPIGFYTHRPFRSVAAFSCNGCGELLCLSMFHEAQDLRWINQTVGDFNEVAQSHGVVVASEYPEHLIPTAPEGVSQTVARAFIQGVDNARHGNADAAAAMFRKAMDVATREIDQSLARKNLAPRIDALASAGKLTSDLQEWAHLIRLDGNQGAHDDDELSEEEISQLQEFTRLFLTYTFTLPSQIKAKKAAAERS